MERYTVSLRCPYCDFVIERAIEMSLIPRKGVVTCYKDNSPLGCDRAFVIEIAFKPEYQIFRLELDEENTQDD